IQYTDEDITQAQEWVRVKFQGKMISRLTMILTENLGKFVSMEQISKEFPNARRNFLSTYISRLRRKLIREKSLYVIEKERGRYKLVIKNRLLRWTIKTSQNEPVCKKALEHLIMAPLGTQIKIVDWQNTITKQFPQTKPEEITEKINRLIIEICTKTQENEFKAVAKKGMIALYESNKIPPEESITENVGKFDEQKMHVRFRARALTDY
ncbi:helix-turn-helix domain-containing protein, partial [Patescibacteria group bacterium]|nr:helix-turn-helix domain-containing protein [Patescibacteria group bacterium]